MNSIPSTEKTQNFNQKKSENQTSKKKPLCDFAFYHHFLHSEPHTFNGLLSSKKDGATLEWPILADGDTGTVSLNCFPKP